jgi:hypothetical protein
MFEAERAAFKEWLRLRQRHFNEVDAAPSDIAELAIMDGFPEIVVREWERSETFRAIGGTSND